MSFLTPVRLQDASRVLRGVALVAARAAAESSVLRRAGEGEVTGAVQEALKSLSQQSKQVADVLDSASIQQTGASLQQHLRTVQQAAKSTASTVTDSTQGAAFQGRNLAQQAFENPSNAASHAAREGRQAAESATAQFQQATSGLQEQGSAAAASALQQGAQGLQQGQNAAGEAGLGEQSEKALGSAAQGLAKQAEDMQPTPNGNAMVMDFSGGVGTASSSSEKISESPLNAATKQRLKNAMQSGESSPDISAGEVIPEALKSSKGLAATQSDSTNSQAVKAGKQETLLGLEQQPAGTSGEARSQAASDAAAVLHSRSSQGDVPISSGPQQSRDAATSEAIEETKKLAAEEQHLEKKEAEVSGRERAEVQAKKEEVRRKLRERRVPSSPIGRVAGFAQLGASLVYGTVADQVSSYFGGGQQSTDSKEGGNRYLTQRNAERLADALCRMRGAALKLGQMLSIQDENVLPPQLTAALERVRAGADIMPKKQLHKALTAELGSEWRNKLQTFDDDPLAAASIGQVHGAVLHDGRRVVLKIQYPGVARSIESDVDNLLRIINLANILPKGLYVENAAKVAKKELKLECDYAYEARCQTRFQQLIKDDKDFCNVMNVPAVVPELCSGSVLCAEWVPGVPIDKVATMPQNVRDAVGTLLLQLTLRELFQWRFMQTDPNWGNFLYDEAAGKLHLIDFGAAREFPVSFVDDYLNMVRACAERDKQGVTDCSTRLGFLTGDESKTMMDAHAQAGFVVGTPFANPGLYDFSSHHSLTKEVSQLGAVMLKHRLTPPPEESYSLHRKLSGAFLACIKLRARVPCRDLFYSAYESHKWGHQGVTAQELPELKLASG